MACEPSPRAPTAVRRTRTKSTSSGTARSGSRPGRHGVRASVMWRRPSPTWGCLTCGRPACGGRACSPSGWRKGWIGSSWTRPSTACRGCTWPSLQPAWLLATGTRRTTGTPCSRTSRVRGPATPSLGTNSSAPVRGTRTASSRASGRGPC